MRTRSQPPTEGTGLDALGRALAAGLSPSFAGVFRSAALVCVGRGDGEVLTLDGVGVGIVVDGAGVLGLSAPEPPPPDCVRVAR